MVWSAGRSARLVMRTTWYWPATDEHTSRAMARMRAAAQATTSVITSVIGAALAPFNPSALALPLESAAAASTAPASSTRRSSAGGAGACRCSSRSSSAPRSTESSASASSRMSRMKPSIKELSPTAPLHLVCTVVVAAWMGWARPDAGGGATCSSLKMPAVGEQEAPHTERAASVTAAAMSYGRPDTSAEMAGMSARSTSAGARLTARTH